jgi:hypothetical protein
MARPLPHVSVPLALARPGYAVTAAFGARTLVVARAPQRRAPRGVRIPGCEIRTFPAARLMHIPP